MENPKMENPKNKNMLLWKIVQLQSHVYIMVFIIWPLFERLQGYFFRINLGSGYDVTVS